MKRSKLSQFALKLCREAAQEIRHAAKPLRARMKGRSTDLLTATDLRVEAFMRKQIRAMFPDHQIVGEEQSGTGPVDLARPTWFLDPVDGTTNYVHGLPFVACNVAFWESGALRLGVTADVRRRRLYWAESDRGSFMGRTRLKVSRTRTMNRAVVSTGFTTDRAENADNNIAEFCEVAPQTRDVRRIGCAGLDTAWVASGELDAYWEQGNGPWDWAVGALLVREAGGKVTNYSGRDWMPGDTDFIASNGKVHDALLATIQQVRKRLELSPSPSAAHS